MARKTKRQKSARNRPRPAMPAAGGVTAPVAGPTAAPRPTARPGGSESLVRSVEMSLAPRAAGAGRRQRGLMLDADPAIPLDRVPYFTGDLMKLGIVAALMLVLLVVGAQLIPILVK